MFSKNIDYKKFLNSNLFYLGLLIILTIPLWLDLLGDHLIQGHDAFAGFIRAVCMERYWGNGQLLVRWAPDVNFGYGSPMFNFYPPFFYYATLLLSKITQNTVLAMNLTCVLFWVLSGMGIYLLAKEFWGNKGAFLSAILYVYSPYYVQDLYVRGAFSEFSSFLILPFLFLSLYKINQKTKTRYIILGIASAFISILTHGMGIFFIVIAFFYVLFLFYLKKDHHAFLIGIFVLLTGFMLSAFYWLPAIEETKYLNLNFLISMRYDFHKNFISLGQLFCVPWDHSKDIDGLSLQIGLVQYVLLLLSLLLPFVIFKNHSDLKRHYFFFLTAGLVTTILTLSASNVLWEHLNTLRFVQLPWRFLTIVTFVVSLLGGGAVMLFKNKTVSSLFLTAVTLLIILSPIGYYRSGHFKVIDQLAVKNNLSKYVFLGEGERTPQWIKDPPLTIPSQKLEIIRGNGQTTQLRSNSPIDNLFELTCDQPILLCFHTFYFPGWRVFIDGKETKIYPDNIYGQIVFIAPSGEHALRIIFGSTPIRIVGMIISWIGAILALSGIICFKFLYKNII